MFVLINALFSFICLFLGKKFHLVYFNQWIIFYILFLVLYSNSPKTLFPSLFLISIQLISTELFFPPLFINFNYTLYCTFSHHCFPCAKLPHRWPCNADCIHLMYNFQFAHFNFMLCNKSCWKLNYFHFYCMQFQLKSEMNFWVKSNDDNVVDKRKRRILNFSTISLFLKSFSMVGQ